MIHMDVTGSAACKATEIVHSSRRPPRQIYRLFNPRHDGPRGRKAESEALTAMRDMIQF